MTQFDKRNISMMMDLYEMTMANGYFANQQEPQKVVFDVFYRKMELSIIVQSENPQIIYAANSC